MIAKILKNCPEGTKLYSPVWGNVELIKVNVLNNIEIKDINEIKYIIYPDGKYSENGEVVLFPSKEQYDWNKFLIPFKNGDVIITTDMTDVYPYENIAIFKEYKEKDPKNKMTIHCQFNANGEFLPEERNVLHENWRLANQEEKDSFFKKMTEVGYCWTGDKLVNRFKIGDCITNGVIVIKITKITDNCYFGYDIKSVVERSVPLHKIKTWKIAKFDICSLRPYDKVLVKSDTGCWYPTLVSYVESSGEVYLIDTTNKADYVIPFEGNEYLIGRWGDPDPYYITWK